MPRPIAVSLAVLLLTAGPAPATPSVESLLRALGITPASGEPPAFTLLGLDGKPHALADLKGQVVLYFWATW